ncbi:MAG: hypothetical protein M3Y04_06835 [Actinomycetota bacterium]|nr:hypothetical protein [Actinomycetota bacterium]
MLKCRNTNCKNEIHYRADPRRIYCSQACNTAAYRARKAVEDAQAAHALDLLSRAATARRNDDAASAETLEDEGLALLVRAHASTLPPRRVRPEPV